MSDFSKRPKEVLTRKTAAKGFGETTNLRTKALSVSLYISGNWEVKLNYS